MSGPLQCLNHSDLGRLATGQRLSQKKSGILTAHTSEKAVLWLFYPHTQKVGAKQSAAQLRAIRKESPVLIAHLPMLALVANE